MENDNKMITTIYADFETYETKCESDGKQWGWTETWNVCNFKGTPIKLKYGYDSESCETNIKLVEGKEYLMVWVNYSSGSTFGIDHNRYASIVELFEMDDRKEAARLAKRIESEPKTFKGPFVTESGRVIKFYPSWGGYFDTLESVRIETVVF